MPLISKTIAGLYNGVSQQTPVLRLDNQCEEQINCLGLIEEGLIRRPFTEHKFTWGSGPSLTSGDKIFFINRGPTEKYFVGIRDDTEAPIWVYDTINGSFKTVQYGHLDENLNFTPDSTVKNYLLDGSPTPFTEKIHVLTVADYTIITNREKTVVMTNDKTDPRPSECYVWFNSVINFGYGARTVVVELSGPAYVRAEMTFDDWSSVTPQYVASGLQTQIHGAGGYSCGVVSSCLRIWREDSQSFDCVVTEPSGGVNVKVMHMQTKKFTDLFPPEMFWGVKFRIDFDTYDNFKGYYVQSNGKAWVETQGWDLKYRLDRTTMPHRLVRMSDGNFVFADIVWADRTVGDDDTAPQPSFVGKQIFATFFYTNRFGVLADDTVIISATADYWNFWPTTALEILDDDPIDLGVAVNDVVSLRAVAPFNEKLLIFADRQQFALSGSPTLTPKTAAITQTTAFACDSYSGVGVVGSNCYFLSPTTNSMHVREYFVEADAYVDDAANITIHVPEYLTLGHYEIIPCPELDMIFFWTPQDRRTLYVYKFFWLGKEKPQSEWCKWTFHNDIYGIGSSRDVLTLLCANTYNTYVVELTLRPTKRIHTSSHDCAAFVDNQIELLGVFDGTKTVWTLPYHDDLTDYLIVTPTGFALNNIVVLSTNQLAVEGNHTSTPMIIGKNFASNYIFTPWVLKTTDQSKPLPGRLQYRTMELVYSDTAGFELEIEARNRDVIRTTSAEFSGFILGEASTDELQLLTGKFKTLIMARADTTTITLKSISHLPFAINAIHQEGFFHERARFV